MRITSRFTLLILAAVFATGLRAAGLATAAVAHNAPMPADQAGMPQDNWKTLTLPDPFRRFAKNEATNDHRDLPLAGWRLASRLPGRDNSPSPCTPGFNATTRRKH